MIKTVYTRQDELVKAIAELYVGDRFFLDPTYNKGLIHKAIDPPLHKSDIDGEKYGVNSYDCTSLPYPDLSVSSIMFDPPFLAGGGKSGVMNDRYSSVESAADLFDFYSRSLIEFFRILSKKGILVFKCQDFINGRTQSMSHCEIYNLALQIGFYARDLFILVTENRARPYKNANQLHARKSHTYFWVFEKSNKKNKRSLPL